MQHSSVRGEEKPFAYILEKHVLSWWQRQGLERLAIAERTASAFRRQKLPELINTFAQKRSGSKSTARGERSYNNVNSYKAIWREDNQAIYNYPAFVFVLEGCADFHVADYVIRCPQNHFLFFRENVPRPMSTKPHLVGDDAAQSRNSVVWFFSPPGIDCVISYICHSHGAKHWSDGYHIVQRRDVVHAFEIFTHEMQENMSQSPVLQSSFQVFLHLYLRELKAGSFLNTLPNFRVTRDMTSIDQAKDYIESHLNQPLTADIVASKVYMSRNSFIEHFKRETGQTFHEYVTKRRMEKAHQLLSTGRWSIRFVCQKIGLRPTRFRIQFREHFHMTPSEFRRQQNLGQKR